MSEPTIFGAETWRKNKLTKIVSGSDHSLALTANGKIFGWGEAESGANGRILKSRARH